MWIVFDADPVFVFDVVEMVVLIKWVGCLVVFVIVNVQFIARAMDRTWTLVVLVMMVVCIVIGV